MLTTMLTVLMISSPVLAIFGLLALAGWRDRRRDAIFAWQIRLTDAIGAQLGAIVAPVVLKPLGGPWRVDIRVPIGRPALVSRIVGIVHDTLTRAGAGPYELVLTPEAAPSTTIRTVTRTDRRLQAA